MEIPDELPCLFSERIEEQNSTYTATVQERELTDGFIHENGTYRVAVLNAESTATANSTAESNQSPNNHAPLVEEGERRRVEIEGTGEEGDGIASVEHGYIIIVPEAEQHEQVSVEITSVTPRFAFGDIIERETDTE